MDKLTTEELKTLIDLVEKVRDNLRLSSYSDKELHAKYTDLGFISIKLNTMLRQEMRDYN
jgi:hypothetical protein